MISQAKLYLLGAAFVAGGLGASAVRAEEAIWTDTRQFGPFTCSATFSLDPYEPLLTELPRLRQELERTLGIVPSDRSLSIHLFSDADQYRDYIEKHFPDAPILRALYIEEQAGTGVYAYRHEALDITLRHECTHAILHASLPYVPLWLDEGLAQYFEVPPDQRAFDHPHLDKLAWNMRFGMVRSAESLEQLHDQAEMGARENRYAWAWVHFMLHGPQAAHEALVSYLSDVDRGVVPPESLSQRLDRAIPSSTERMVRHFKYWRK